MLRPLGMFRVDIGGDYAGPAIRTRLKDMLATILAAIWRAGCRSAGTPGSDGDRVELLAGVLGDDKPDPHGHGDHEDRYRQESESEGTRSLLQRHSSERPQHKADEEANEPHHTVGDAASGAKPAPTSTKLFERRRGRGAARRNPGESKERGETGLQVGGIRLGWSPCGATSFRSPPGDDGGATHLPSAMFLLEIGTTLVVGQHPDSRAPTLK